MALTPEGTPYVESTDLVANYPAASLSLANRVDLVGVLPFADSAARTTAIPSPTDGQYSYLQDSNSTQFWNGSAWQNNNGGLIKTASVSLSGSNIFLNNCFNSSYLTYKIIVATTAATNMDIRLSVGGVANTSNVYVLRGYYGGTASGNLDTTDTNWNVNSGTAVINFISIYLHNPAVASETFGVYQLFGGGLYGENYGIRHTASTAFDGLQLVGTSITGVARVYGLEQ
jgi:hypothetical protein